MRIEGDQCTGSDHGAVATGSGDELTVSFRIHDVFAGQEYGKGLQFKEKHLTGAAWPIRSPTKFTAASQAKADISTAAWFLLPKAGPRDNAANDWRLWIMMGNNWNIWTMVRIWFWPRIAPDGQSVLFTSYETGFPRIYQMDLRNKRRKLLQNAVGTTSFAPRFSPDGTQIVYSQEQGGNTDVFVMSLRSGQARRLTSAPLSKQRQFFTRWHTDCI